MRGLAFARRASAGVLGTAATAAALMLAPSARAQVPPLPNSPQNTPTGPISAPSYPVRSDIFMANPSPGPAPGPDTPSIELAPPVPSFLSPSPFSAPLLPSVPLPPVAPVIPITPMPPAVPAPYALPEQPGVPPPLGGLQQALSEYDRRAGLSTDGALVSVLRDRLMNAPVRGSALIQVRIDRQRRVAEARIVASSERDAAWREFAEGLVGLVLPAMRMPETAHGAWMRVQVDAKPRMPSGKAPRRPAWIPGTAIAFDAADLAVPAQLVVHAAAVSEVWY